MKFHLVLGALLLSASPVLAEIKITCFQGCIENKESQIQEEEKYYQMAYQQVQNPENTIDLARQMVDAGRLSKDLSQKEKNAAAYKLMTDQLHKMRSQIKAYKTYPDCSELQGGKGQ